MVLIQWGYNNNRKYYVKALWFYIKTHTYLTDGHLKKITLFNDNRRKHVVV